MSTTNFGGHQRRMQLSLNKMLSMMPVGITFLENAAWRGVNHKYRFHHTVYGEFRARPRDLMYQSWPRGCSGHPSDRYTGRLKAVECIDTGEMFSSVEEASATLGIDASDISRVCNGIYGVAQGLKFRFRVAG